MNWKFWEKQEPIWEVDTTEVPATTLYRWFLYDSGIEDPNKYAITAGFSPVSDEGDEMERKESLERLLRVMPYKAFVDMMSAMNGQVLAETLTETLQTDGLLENDSRTRMPLSGPPEAT